MTLSKREKRMLYLLGYCLLLTVGIYLFILPAISRHTSLSTQLAELEAQQLTRVQAITDMNKLDTHIKLLKKELERARARYATPIFSETLDTQFTSMLRRYNAVPVSFTIGEAAIVPVPHYGEGRDNEDTPLTAADVPPLQDYMAAVDKGALKTITPELETTTEDTAVVPTIEAKPLKLEAIISQSEAVAFMSELSADPAILIQTMAVSTVAAEVDATGNMVASDKVMLTLEFSYLLAPDLPYDNDAGVPSATFS